MLAWWIFSGCRDISRLAPPCCPPIASIAWMVSGQLSPRGGPEKKKVSVFHFWGCSISGCSLQVQEIGFSSATSPLHLLKLQGATPTLQHFNPLLRDRHVMVKTDNCTAIAYNNRQSTAHSAALLKLAGKLLSHLLFISSHHEWITWMVSISGSSCLSSLFLCF